ncbi:hypothetical protein TWF694_005710 [Orbilia ellipsospora]|uniref:Uncharacterized protein n=1 Tax=Orbilia ellipsospora TaxID=2528407 RepID=A0AAV9WST5_9PEZI
MPTMRPKALAWKIAKETPVFSDTEDDDDTCSVDSGYSYSSDEEMKEIPSRSSSQHRSSPTSPSVQRYERVPGLVRENVSKYEALSPHTSTATYRALSVRSRSPSPTPSSCASSQTYVSPRSSFTSASESVPDQAPRSVEPSKVDSEAQFEVNMPVTTPSHLNSQTQNVPAVTVQPIEDQDEQQQASAQELSIVSSAPSHQRARREFKHLFKDRKRREDSLPSPPASPPRPRTEPKSPLRGTARRNRDSPIKLSLETAKPQPEPSLQPPQLQDLRLAVQNILKFLQSGSPKMGDDWQHYVALLIKNVENIARQLNDNDHLDVQALIPYQWSRMICEVGHIAVMMACPPQPISESSADAFFNISKFYLLGLRSVQCCPCGLTTK